MRARRVQLSTGLPAIRRVRFTINLSDGSLIHANQTMIMLDQCDTGFSGVPCSGSATNNSLLFQLPEPLDFRLGWLLLWRTISSITPLTAAKLRRSKLSHVHQLAKHGGANDSNHHTRLASRQLEFWTKPSGMVR